MKLWDALRRAFRHGASRRAKPMPKAEGAQARAGVASEDHMVRKGAYMRALRTLDDFEVHLSNNREKDRYADTLYVNETSGMFAITRILLHLYGTDYESMDAMAHMSLALAMESNATVTTPPCEKDDHPYTGNLNADFLTRC